MNNNKPFDGVKMIAVKKETLMEKGCINNCQNKKFETLEENVLRCPECGKNYIILPDLFIAALIHESELNMGVYNESDKYGTETRKKVTVKTKVLKPNSYHSIK